MTNSLIKFSRTKTHFVLDFDRTLARMEIDWTDWHLGISEIYSKYDRQHGYRQGKNPHKYHNILVEKYGEDLLNDVNEFNKNYENKYLTGFTPNIELVEFIKENNSLIFYVYSSNTMPTIVSGLDELKILSKIETIVSRDDVRFLKPNPEGFYLFDNFQTKRASFLMIGDSDADREAAKAAEVDFLECNVFEKYIE